MISISTFVSKRVKINLLWMALLHCNRPMAETLLNVLVSSGGRRSVACDINVGNKSAFYKWHFNFRPVLILAGAHANEIPARSVPVPFDTYQADFSIDMLAVVNSK